MSQHWRCILSCLVVCLLVPLAMADGSAEEAERKAEQLEQSVVETNEDGPATPAAAIDKPEAQAVDPAGEAPLDDPITCLARSIYWEARGEDVADMEAVANVVMNRLGDSGFPDTVCGVVRQGSEQGACQFSWWCDGRVDEADEDSAYAQAKEIARRALNQQLGDRTGGALYFHHRSVRPSWAAEFAKTVDVGGFAFYRPRGGASH
ncbi:cell wall hydrolase [Halomonas nitroreducens]|uniref:Cell wall hydrolase n=1 Tax=Halomonas nitroreducens TaxID=447425 RepID=A0A3S0JZB0_9GAMM|nr:cell wall hydrolase [Halomonas nitroreducens]RTR05944.1 cell wall hydrolase [Halomonas nitroreducens]